MSRDSVEGKRIAPTSTRRRMPAPAVAAATALWSRRSSRPPAPPAVARLADIPSHDARYRASIVPLPDPIERNRPLSWTVAVRTAAGVPVEGAALALESRMPDEGRLVAPRPRATAEPGGGRYRVQGLCFDRSGWWNVRLRISAAALTPHHSTLTPLHWTRLRCRDAGAGATSPRWR